MRFPRIKWFLALAAVSMLAGCSNWNLLSRRAQSPDDESIGGSKVRLVGDLTAPYGTMPVAIEGVGLVTNLPGTGSDPGPSAYRGALLTEMKRQSVEDPNTLLASDTTAMVLVEGRLPPGIQEGDPFDLRIRVPSQSETISLRGGRLVEVRLRQLAVLGDNRIHEGRLWGLGEGPILVDPSADPEKNRVEACRGLVLGGGRAVRSRSLGLVLKPGHQNVFNASRIAKVVNKRFFRNDRGIQEGVAKAENDKYIELKVHPRYKDNIPRYLQVVRSVAIHETSARRMERIALLEKQLLDPVTAWRAALQLEAIGRDGVESLKKGIAMSDPEVRFRSAEALAYLDRSEAAKPLGEAARTQPAFRVFALSALSAMNDVMARDELAALLDVPSAETRYGAFRALWTMDSRDPAVAGEWLGDEFSLHVVDTKGPPMVHFTRSKRPEVVLFGHDQRLATPLLLEAGPRISITSHGEQISVSRFAIGQADQKRIVSNRLDDIIRAIVDLGGTYPDVVQAIQQAKAKGILESRLEVDALPEAGRTYHRGLAGAEGPEEAEGPDAGKNETVSAGKDETEPPRRPFGGLFAKMTGRDST
ncbi:MAG: flagellar basal body P-ring protein FlgI [Pirellulales bacterium]|nr:flagellar basal body P-ring protein FlgI [Pirellulales bacterium]